MPGPLPSPASLPEIPNKLYFRIGEVSKIVGVEPYVLRYWESEFTGVSPKKSGTGHRLYRQKDVQLLLEIKRLLYENRYTIEGARKHLSLQTRNRRPAPPPPSKQGDLFGSPDQDMLREVRRELRAILELLK